MPPTYSAHQRLEEQVSILVREDAPTSIVLMSELGPDAIDYLLEYVPKVDAEGELYGTDLDTSNVESVIRALGMIADAKAEPRLVDLFTGLDMERYHGERVFRATANALRKIGTPTCLDAILDRLDDFDPKRAIATVGAFGEEGSQAVKALLEAPTGPSRHLAIAMAASYPQTEFTKIIVTLATTTTRRSETVVAARALTNRTKVAIKPLIGLLKAATGMKQDDRNWMSDEVDGYESNYDDDDIIEATLSALFHGTGVDAVNHLVPVAAHEEEKDDGWKADRVADTIVAFGRDALAQLEGSYVERFDDKCRDIATRLAARIRQGDKEREPKKWDLDRLTNGRARI